MGETEQLAQCRGVASSIFHSVLWHREPISVLALWGREEEAREGTKSWFGGDSPMQRLFGVLEPNLRISAMLRLQKAGSGQGSFPNKCFGNSPDFYRARPRSCTFSHPLSDGKKMGKAFAFGLFLLNRSYLETRMG